LRNPERVTLLFVRPLRWLLLLSYPAVRFLSASSDGIMKMMRLKPAPDNVISEEEIKVLVEQGTEGGVFEQDEREMFEGVLELANTRAAALMTPRNRMEWLDLNHSEEELRRQLAASAHTRFPVARGDLDAIVGVLHAKEYFSKRQRSEPVKLEHLIHKAVVIPENASALHALREFKRAKEHIALVINEHGTLRGLLTINDVLEAVVGAIPTPFDPAPKVAVQRADGSWLVEGMIDIDEFKEMFQIVELPNEEGQRYQTLGGFIVNHLSRIPTAGDFFEWETLRVEVVDMDGPRVDKVLVGRIRISEENKSNL
ncbi:MAG: hemolysin family protein, partial [bacterium]|nr:hemolysin family protein [bacterium]